MKLTMNTAAMTFDKRDTMPRSLDQLPQDEQDKLREIRDSEDLPALRLRVLALRQAKWPLRAIGDPLGAPRSTVRMWERGADQDAELPSVPECDRASRDRGERVVRLYLDVPPDERKTLKELAASARNVRGSTSSTAPARVAADKLDVLINKYISERKIPVKHIADRMGVTPRAVAARHERFVGRENGTDA